MKTLQQSIIFITLILLQYGLVESETDSDEQEASSSVFNPMGVLSMLVKYPEIFGGMAKMVLENAVGGAENLEKLTAIAKELITNTSKQILEDDDYNQEDENDTDQMTEINNENNNLSNDNVVEEVNEYDNELPQTNDEYYDQNNDNEKKPIEANWILRLAEAFLPPRTALDFIPYRVRDFLPLSIRKQLLEIDESTLSQIKEMIATIDADSLHSISDFLDILGKKSPKALSVLEKFLANGKSHFETSFWYSAGDNGKIFLQEFQSDIINFIKKWNEKAKKDLSHNDQVRLRATLTTFSPTLAFLVEKFLFDAEVVETDIKQILKRIEQFKPLTLEGGLTIQLQELLNNFSGKDEL